jgi:hypothetical protein
MLLRPRILVPLFLALAVLASAPVAFARGGNYFFEGGTAAQRARAQVEKALSVSSFDWSVVRSQVTIHIGRNLDSHATPGNVWLDSRFRTLLMGRRPARVRPPGGLPLADPGEPARAPAAARCEGLVLGHLRVRALGLRLRALRFHLAWAYWQNADNCMKPASKSDEAGGMTPAAFRASRFSGAQ